MTFKVPPSPGQLGVPVEPLESEVDILPELDTLRAPEARTVLVAGDPESGATAHVRRSTFSRLMAPLAIAASGFSSPMFERGRRMSKKKGRQPRTLDEVERMKRRQKRKTRRKGPWRPRGAARWRGATK